MRFYAAYLASTLVALLVAGTAQWVLARPFRHVLLELTGSAAAARFFRIATFALFMIGAATGSLLPSGWLDTSAHTPGQLLSNTVRQLLGAGGVLLLALGACSFLLVVLIARYEARRAKAGRT